MVPSCAFGSFSLSDDALEAGIEAEMSRHTEERRGSQTRVQWELRPLDVSGLPKRTCISGDLPNLETLIYCGWNSGIVPQFTRNITGAIPLMVVGFVLVRQSSIN